MTFCHALSKDILTMAFRQVVLQQLWNFELLLFIPRAVRNMKELQDPRKVCSASLSPMLPCLSVFALLYCNLVLVCLSWRWLIVLIGSVLLCLSYQQVPASFCLSSSDEGVISVLAEVICISSLQRIRIDILFVLSLVCRV